MHNAQCTCVRVLEAFSNMNASSLGILAKLLIFQLFSISIYFYYYSFSKKK